MNFAEVIKKEIINKPIKDKHCKKAFLAGIIRGSGELYYKDDELGLDFKVNSEEIVVLVSNYLHSLFGYDVSEISIFEDKLNKKDNYILSINGQRALEILKNLEIITNQDDEQVVNLKFYGAITEKDCCLRSFLRGLFLTNGNCTVPTPNDSVNTGYHLELSFSHYTPALQTSEKFAEHNVLTKITRRRENYIVYIKSAEEIKDFVAFLSAPVSVLKLTDLIINRGIVNDSNRRKNCDLGNVNRQIEASAKQVEAIVKIDQTIGMDSLKPDLKSVAVARMQNPDETLVELADRLGVSKSCLNHRLRKLVCVAKEL